MSKYLCFDGPPSQHQLVSDDVPGTARIPNDQLGEVLKSIYSETNFTIAVAALERDPSMVTPLSVMRDRTNPEPPAPSMLEKLWKTPGVKRVEQSGWLLFAAGVSPEIMTSLTGDIGREAQITLDRAQRSRLKIYSGRVAQRVNGGDVLQLSCTILHFLECMQRAVRSEYAEIVIAHISNACPEAQLHLCKNVRRSLIDALRGREKEKGLFFVHPAPSSQK